MPAGCDRQGLEPRRVPGGTDFIAWPSSRIHQSRSERSCTHHRPLIADPKRDQPIAEVDDAQTMLSRGHAIHSRRTPVGRRRPLDGSDYPRSKASQAKSIALDCCTKVSSCSAKSLH